jgi:16S rRNA G966 N2-methylase RsmD
MITKSFKWHPQPSSIRKSTMAAKKANVRDKIVLDCFCGGGSHGIASIISGARCFIGTDLEDYSFCLRKDIARYNFDYQTFGDKTISFEWNVDAKTSISSHVFDILFIDPPNPYQVAGGTTKSVIRDTGMSGSKLTKFWKEKFNPENLINKREDTLLYVKDIFDLTLNMEKRLIVNLFEIKSNKFSYFEKFKDEFKTKQLFESYFEIL